MTMDLSGIKTGLPITEVAVKGPHQAALVQSGYSDDGANFLGFAHSGLDRRSISWENAYFLGLPYRTPVDQMVQLPLSLTDIHAMVMVDNRIFGMTVPFYISGLPCQFIRFNNLEDLTDYNIVTIPLSVGANNDCSQVAYSRATKKFYGFVGARFFVFDPETMVATQTALGTAVVGQGGIYNTSQAAATDDTYLYFASYTFNTGTTIYRFLLSNLALPAVTLNLPNNSQAHHMTTAGGKLYLNGRETTLNAAKNYAWVARIDLATFTLDEVATITTHFISTKSMAIVGDYLWMGLEVVGQAMRIRATALTQQQVIATGCNGTFAGIYYDGFHVWIGTNSSPVTLLRIEPLTLEVTQYQTPDQFVVDILGDGARLFIQCTADIFNRGPTMTRLTAPLACGQGGWSGAGACPSLTYGPNGMGHGTFSPQYGAHIVGGGARFQGLATPPAPSAGLIIGGAAGAYSYYIVAIDSSGHRSLVSPVLNIANGPTVLDNSHFIDLRWALVEGAVSYDVLKTNTSTKLGTVTACRIIDSGQATSAYTPPTRNETADVKVDGFFNLTQVTPANSADAVGVVGDCARDDSYVYVKTAAGWKRAALAAF